MFIGDLFNKKTITESLRPGERHHFETDPKTGKRVYKGIRGDQHDTPKRDTAGDAQERRDRDTDAMRKHDRRMSEQAPIDVPKGWEAKTQADGSTRISKIGSMSSAEYKQNMADYKAKNWTPEKIAQHQDKMASGGYTDAERAANYQQQQQHFGQYADKPLDEQGRGFRGVGGARSREDDEGHSRGGNSQAKEYNAEREARAKKARAETLAALQAAHKKQKDIKEAVPYALSAANAAAEYRRQGAAGGGYRGRIDIPVQSREDYLAVGNALTKAARAAGQRIEYGVSDGVMSIFSDSMDSDELDQFIDDVLNQGLAEGKADPVGSWVVYDGSKVKRFKSREGAKAYAEKNGGKVASSEHYADNIQKQGVAEGAPELLKAEMPLVRHIEKELAQHGYEKGTPEYDQMFKHSIAMYRKFGNVDAIKQGVAETKVGGNVLTDPSTATHTTHSTIWPNTSQERKLDPLHHRSEEAMRSHIKALKKKYGADNVSTKVKTNQSVAEGFSDIVKGVKRKVAGKADPKEVEKDYAVKARREIGDANRYNNPAAYADSDKAVKRYNKVAKVVNKEGVAEGFDDLDRFMKAKYGPKPSGGSGIKHGTYGQPGRQRGRKKGELSGAFHQGGGSDIPHNVDFDRSHSERSAGRRMPRFSDDYDSVKRSEVDEGSVQDKLYKKHQELRKKRGAPDPDYYKELKKTYDMPDDERWARTAELKKKYQVTNEEVERYIEELGRAGYEIVNEKKIRQRLDPKCWKGKHKEGTKIKGGVRVNNCVPNK